jgi:hypothetical protein
MSALWIKICDGRRCRSRSPTLPGGTQCEQAALPGQQLDQPRGSMKAKERPSRAVHEQSEAREALARLRAHAGVKGVIRVERAARRGELHSDPETAALALQWARTILSAEARYTGRPLFFSYLTEIFTGGFNQDGTRALYERRSIRTAEQIVSAHEARPPTR